MTATTPNLLAAYHRAALMRPPQWPGARAYPTAGAFCSRCNGQQFRCDGDGWLCEACHPRIAEPEAA
jgi:hypothetical protein